MRSVGVLADPGRGFGEVRRRFRSPVPVPGAGCPGAGCRVPGCRVPGPGCRVPGARVPGARVPGARVPDELAEKTLHAN